MSQDTSDRLAASDVRVQRALGRKRQKYGAVQVQADGKRFASKREYRRWLELVLLERAGEIQALQFQPEYPLHVCGVKVSLYRGDFAYVETASGEVVLEDTKSAPTRMLSTYRLKKRMVEAEYGLVIREV